MLFRSEAKINVVEWPSPEYIKKAKLKNDKLKPGQSTNIEFELSKEAPIGRFNAAISLEVKGKSNSRITIPIKGSIVNEITIPKEKTNGQGKKKGDS